MVAETMPQRVCVVGASGALGRIVLRNLLSAHHNDPKTFGRPIGTIRSEASRLTLGQYLSQEEDEGRDRNTHSSVTAAAAAAAAGESSDGGRSESKPTPELRFLNLTASDSATEDAAKAMKDVDAVVVCSACKPKVSLSSLPGVIVSKLFGGSTKPSFYFPEGEGPEEVEWKGGRIIIDAAIQAGVKHMVYISSMCGTRPAHFLNTNMGNGKCRQGWGCQEIRKVEVV